MIIPIRIVIPMCIQCSIPLLLLGFERPNCVSHRLARSPNPISSTYRSYPSKLSCSNLPRIELKMNVFSSSGECPPSALPMTVPALPVDFNLKEERKTVAIGNSDCLRKSQCRSLSQRSPLRHLNPTPSTKAAHSIRLVASHPATSKLK